MSWRLLAKLLEAAATVPSVEAALAAVPCPRWIQEALEGANRRDRIFLEIATLGGTDLANLLRTMARVHGLCGLHRYGDRVEEALDTYRALLRAAVLGELPGAVVSPGEHVACVPPTTHLTFDASGRLLPCACLVERCEVCAEAVRQWQADHTPGADA